MFEKAASSLKERTGDPRMSSGAVVIPSSLVLTLLSLSAMIEILPVYSRSNPDTMHNKNHPSVSSAVLCGTGITRKSEWNATSSCYLASRAFG